MKNYIQKIKSALDLEELEKLRIEVFGKKGVLAASFAKLKTLANEEKKAYAKEINDLKIELSDIFSSKKEELVKKHTEALMQKEGVDVTLFDAAQESGALHPVQATMDKIIDYFLNMNYEIQEGPLVEDDFHNFEALNLPEFHPARDMQDTFFFKDGMLLRTHTSPVQIRTMLSKKPPIRMISPGAVFRKDLDLTHTPQFHQVEGLVVEEGDKVSFSNLKFILEDFLTYMFGDVKVRFRPSFFPFTEPSAEVDISCIFCKGEGCRVCSHTGWLEVLGCGMVDPNVYKAVGYENVSGFAFGLGVERFAMLLHQIPDLRSLYEGDLRLLEQFK